MISIDTLRADHLSAYGNTRIRTPKIDAFAANGTLFSSAGKVLGGANRNRYAVRESRDGAFVLRAATEWLAGRREEPFFAFVHLFDLHQPYRVAGGYDGELQYRLYEKALAEAYDGRTNAAIVRLRSILERDPHNTLAQRDLDEHLGLLPDARKELETACKIAPEAAQCRQELQKLRPALTQSGIPTPR